MMKGHILLERARRYPEPTKVPTPVGCAFQETHGYWTKNGTNRPMMLDDPEPVTSKKCDIETGEDQKGE